MTDVQIRKDVYDALEFDPSLDAADIGVIINDGVATLTGHVQTYSERVAAEKIALRVRGVRAVAQEIEVRPPKANLTADDEIARRVVDALRWNTLVPRDAVKVAVSKGAVNLLGTVEWNYQRAAAAETVQGLFGVVSLYNAVLIAPKLNAPDIKDRIVKAFVRDAELEAALIKLDVEGGKVTMQGKVHSHTERVAAEHAAWAIPGVTSVVDNLVVSV